MLGARLLSGGSLYSSSNIYNPNPKKHESWFLLVLLVTLIVVVIHTQAFGATRIPGSDASDKLEAAGTLLRIVDSFLFVWGARIFAGLCIMSAGWSLKEQRFGIAVLCVVSAIVLGTAPVWVKNIFEIGGGGGVFSRNSIEMELPHA